jgi:hypothetical protein
VSSTNPTTTYRNSLHKTVLQNGGTVAGDVTAFHAWYTSVGRNEFIQAFEHETQLKLTGTNRSVAALVEHGYPKNVNEYSTKTAWDNYYIANALIALRELDKIFNRITPVPAAFPDIWYQNIREVTRKLFIDTIVLIDDWAAFRQHVPGVLGVGKNRFEHAVAIYHSALQVIYGNYSPLAFSDNHSDTSVNQLRMAIEIRLRRAFGIAAKLTLSGDVVPLALSEVFNAVRPCKQVIDFAVPLEHIERLYGWANIYMHSGLKQYVWSPIYALDYLRELLVGGKYAGGFSVSAGISTTFGIVKQVQSAVEARIDKKRHSLVVVDPQDCDLILKP